jgi:hypothetical protein
MSKRNEWVVSFEAGEVAAAARAKREHHERRLTYWRGRHEEAQVEMRESGIELDEAVNYAYSNSMQPRVNSAVWQKFMDCHKKVEEHRFKVDTYRAWERALTVAAERSQRVDLDVEDVEFFAL